MSLVVYCPYFGAMPPWIRLTLRSMAMNRHVAFYLIGDQLPSSAHARNIHLLNMSFGAYRAMVQRLSPRTLQWKQAPCVGFNCGTASKTPAASKSNKISDSRPFLGAALASTTSRYAWWAWMDIDVIFGHLDILPKARAVFCPLWPNPFGLVTWGVFTAFRTDATLIAKPRVVGANASSASASGLHPYRIAHQWREALASPRREAFEELSTHCGGPSCGLGMSNALSPRNCQTMKAQVAEVNRCAQKVRWGPCARGPTSFATLSLERHAAERHPTLVTNGVDEVMLLHLFQSKARWRDVPDVSHWTCVNITNFMGEGSVRVVKC